MIRIFKIHFFIVIAFLLFSANIVAQNTFSFPLNEGWKLRNVKQSSWMNVPVPGCVQTELIKRKMIPSPLWGNDEKACAWVDNESWEYANYFDVPSSMMGQKSISIIFEGIDTYAKVYLNGICIGDVNNMHRTWNFDVKNYLRRYDNLLSVTFTGVQKYADSLAAKDNIVLPTDSRAYVRKAAYQFGWDFSPKVLTMGIYKSVYIKSGDIAVSPYPVYSIIQPLAQFDEKKFQFSINGKPIFIKGINMVPPSILLPTSNRYYDSIISQCKQANINMIRIWGGGVYPPDYFYTLCDENNIMVWQDFMFANLLLPHDENLKTNLLREVEDAVRKLRHHTCIVLWCGNNEIDEGWHNWGWQKKYTNEQCANIWQDYLQFYTIEIPNIIKVWDDARPYIASSPKIGWGKPESMEVGDSHYWGVWWGKEPIANYWTKVPRFMSEYGMQAMPDIHTVHQFCDAKQMNFSDSNFTNHQKNTEGFSTISHYLQDYPMHRDSLGYIYFTQMMQRDALQTAIMAHRSAFPYCNGTMPWQLNDVWPAISWSIIDFFGRPKSSYYTIKNLYDKNALTLGKFIAQNDTNILDTNIYRYALSICEPTIEMYNMETTFSVMDFYGEVVYKTDKIDWIKGEGGNYYTTSFFDKANFDSYNWGMSYLLVEIKNKDGLDIQQPFYFTKPKNLKLQPTFYDVQWLNDTTFQIGTLNFAKDVFLYCKNEDVVFSENYFDLLPTKEKIITVHGFNKKTDSLQVYSQIDMSNE
jgi:beta-mannosidase